MDGIGWAAGAMISARSRLEIATGNLANASTDGFRKHLAHGVLTQSGVRIGVEVSSEQGALRRTGRPFDLALVGPGAFTVVDEHGRSTQTRDGAFSRDRYGALRDDTGRRLTGTRGIIRVPEGAAIDPDGTIRKDGVVLDRLPFHHGTSLQSGFLESSNVNAIAEMIDLLGAQRSFESAQKVMSAIDAVEQKTSNEIARLK
ncbi:MAG: flagellar basal body protein [Candidatus Eremiobacteraeota bacterium]|nr:flagellar basal body protein [Candidatus Eremiobacteraeota bacterium]